MSPDECGETSAFLPSCNISGNAERTVREKVSFYMIFDLGFGVAWRGVAWLGVVGRSKGSRFMVVGTQVRTQQLR